MPDFVAAELFDNLQVLNYTGRVDAVEKLTAAMVSGQPNALFYDVVTWLSSHLVALTSVEATVTVDEEFLQTASLQEELKDPLEFLVELSSLFSELRCPIKQLTTGKLDERFLDGGNKRNAIDYLVQELFTAKINAVKNPKAPPLLEIKLIESKTAKNIKDVLILLSFSRPPDNITPQRLFGEMEKRISSLSQPVSPIENVPELMFTGTLTCKQWHQLEKLYSGFLIDYKNRKGLQLARVELTIQSFFWTDKFKNSSCNEITKRLVNKGICTEPAVDLSDVLSATADLFINEKTSSDAVRKNTKSSVNTVKIGQVPDRGGRPHEQKPPPPEVPSWQKNEPTKPRTNSGQSSGANRQNQRYNSGRNPAGDNFAAFGNPVPQGTYRNSVPQGTYRNSVPQSQYRNSMPQYQNRNTMPQYQYRNPMYQSQFENVRMQENLHMYNHNPRQYFRHGGGGRRGHSGRGEGFGGHAPVGFGGHFYG